MPPTIRKRVRPLAAAAGTVKVIEVVPLAPALPEAPKNSDTSKMPFWLKSIHAPKYWFKSVPNETLKV